SPHRYVFTVIYASTTEIYTLSLHDALPIYKSWVGVTYTAWKGAFFTQQMLQGLQTTWHLARGKYKQAGQSYSAGDRAFFEGSSEDRKSTRLNSSHVKISYAVFCLKKKKIIV